MLRLSVLATWTVTLRAANSWMLLLRPKSILGNLLQRTLTQITVKSNLICNRHSLPESPPDSEHPYSPQDGCEAPLTAENVYSSIYKEEIFNPIGNFLSPSNVVLDQNSQGLVDENGLLQVWFSLFISLRIFTLISYRMIDWTPSQTVGCSRKV